MACTRTFISLAAMLILPATGWCQAGDISQFKPDPVKVQMYTPYLAARHGGPAGLATFKSGNMMEYMNELWYYTESFSIKQNYLTQGETMDPAMIDISRFEQHRLPAKDTVYVIPGYRDAIVLPARSKLLHQPAYTK